jgi:hypothetical protein
MVKNKTAVDPPHISTQNQVWLQELQTISQIIQQTPDDRSGSKYHDFWAATVVVFWESITKLNDGLHLTSLFTISDGEDAEMDNYVAQIVADLQLVTPHIRRLYESLPQAWFPRETVVSHCVWHSLTWSDIVLQAAEHTYIHTRFSGAIKAGKSLWKTGYDSAMILPHLELEFAFINDKWQAEIHLEPPIPPAEILPFGLQKCDVANWLRRQGFDDPVEIKEVYAKAMDAFIAAAPHAISKQKREHLKATGCDVRNAPKELRKILDNIGLTIKNWTLKELEN